MSDISTEGPPAKPYRENPPTHFREVHWKTGTTTWPTKPFSYLQSGMAKLAESFTGTASFWLRTNDVRWTITGTYEPHFNVVYVPGPRFYATYEYEGADHNTYLGNVPDYGFYIRIARTEEPFIAIPGSLYCTLFCERAIGDITSRFSFASDASISGPASVPGDIVDHKWAHFLFTWDLNAAGGGRGTLTVNKVARTVYYNRASYDYNEEAAEPVDFIPQPVPWREPARFFGAEGIYTLPGAVPTIGPAVPFLDNWFISLAHVWISTTHVIDDVSKFVSEDGTPAKLGKDGAVVFIDPATGKVTDEHKPDYYFRGGPKEFVQNFATAGGAVSLLGELPIAQSINPKIGA